MTKLRMQQALSTRDQVLSATRKGGHGVQELDRAAIFFWQQKAQDGAYRWMLDEADTVSNFSKDLNTLHLFDVPIAGNLLRQMDLHSERIGKDAPEPMKFLLGLWHRGTEMCAAFLGTEKFNWDNHENIVQFYSCDSISDSKAYLNILAMCLGLDCYSQQQREINRNVSRIKPRVTLSKPKPPTDFNVIVLRRPTPEILINASVSHRAGSPSCEFDVMGFYRNQWYPGTGEHKRIFIPGFTKGKGLPRKETVRKVIR